MIITYVTNVLIKCVNIRKGDERMKCKNCKHEEKFHAVKENHISGTSHCTKIGCDCKEFTGGDINEKREEIKTN